jgi:hypothetical protein
VAWPGGGAGEGANLPAAVQSAHLQTMLLKRLSRPGAETVAALIGTTFSAILLILTAMNAGPLWRDEVNTLNLAQMSSLKEIWNNLPFESFPPSGRCCCAAAVRWA